jgi:hypothetical protein
MEYMYLVWYVIVCGRKYTPCAEAAIIAFTIPPTQNNVSAKMHILHVQELLSWPSPFLPHKIMYQPRCIPAHGVYVSWMVGCCVWEEW